MIFLHLVLLLTYKLKLWWKMLFSGLGHKKAQASRPAQHGEPWYGLPLWLRMEMGSGCSGSARCPYANDQHGYHHSGMCRCLNLVSFHHAMSLHNNAHLQIYKPHSHASCLQNTLQHMCPHSWMPITRQKAVQPMGSLKKNVYDSPNQMNQMVPVFITLTWSGSNQIHA